MVRYLPTMEETQVQSLHREDLLKEEMAAHSSILAWANQESNPGLPHYRQMLYHLRQYRKQGAKLTVILLY